MTEAKIYQMFLISGTVDPESSKTNAAQTEEENAQEKPEDLKAKLLLQTPVLTAGISSALGRLFDHHGLPIPTQLR